MTPRPSYDTTASTLLEVFARHAALRRSQRAYVFLGADGAEKESINFGDLYQQACKVAAALIGHGNRPGDRVLLMYPSGLDFIRCFLGTLLAGMVAVPVMAPRANEGMSRLAGIVGNAGVGAVLAARETLERIARSGPEFHARMRDLFVTPAGGGAGFTDWRPSEGAARRPAFLQYTSGSTGAPKGVVITHANLIDNQRAIAHAFGHDAHSTVVVGWLPMYHDMGLIGNVLQPLFLGRPCILMSPLDFLVRPLRWLQAIDRYRATTSGGPNFAYDLCVQKVDREDAGTLDLSSWRLAFSGAEPVRASTLARFASHFAPAGFSSRAFYPCYGLAEATLFVTGPEHGTGASCLRSGSLEPLASLPAAQPGVDFGHLVSAGTPRGDCMVRIVDPDTGKVCGDGGTGEIWVSGSSVATGYWEDSENTAQTFGAELAGEPGRRFLRTGDLGFLTRDGHLIVVGRLKDVIIVRGANYYAEDIEAVTAAAHPQLAGTRCAAFSVEATCGEQLIILAEVPRKGISVDEGKAAAEMITGEVTNRFGISPHAVKLTRHGALPITTSGKIRRRQCKADYLAGVLHALF